MPRSRPSSPPWPLVIVWGLHLIFGAIVITLWLVGAKTPPAAVGSFIAASIVSAVVLATRRRCDCRTEITALAQLVQSLTERIGELEQRQAIPHPVVLVPAPRRSEEAHEGLGPEAIEALRRMDRRLGDRE